MASWVAVLQAPGEDDVERRARGDAAGPGTRQPGEPPPRDADPHSALDDSRVLHRGFSTAFSSENANSGPVPRPGRNYFPPNASFRTEVPHETPGSRNPDPAVGGLSGRRGPHRLENASFAADGKVTIDTYKGSIRVTPWDRAEVAVEARIVPDDSCGPEKDQREWVAATEVVIEPSGRNVRIESDYDKLETSWVLPVLHEPPVRPLPGQPASRRDLKIHDYKSDTDVKDFAGTSRSTPTREVSRFRPPGGLDLKTYKGEVRAGFKRLSGAVHAETYKGDVTLTFPAGANSI